MASGDPDVEAAFRKAKDAMNPADITQVRNADGGIPQSYLEADPTLNDYYTTRDLAVLELTDKRRRRHVKGSAKQKRRCEVKAVHGLVMPLILEFEYADGEKEVRRIQPKSGK